MEGSENTGNRVEAGETIVVGAIGSAAPWFLTGWAHDDSPAADIRTPGNRETMR